MLLAFLVLFSWCLALCTMNMSLHAIRSLSPMRWSVLTTLGMPQEILNDSFLSGKHNTFFYNTQNTGYALSIVIAIIFLSAMFIYAIFRKIIRKMVLFQHELYEEKEKLQYVSNELQHANEQLKYQLHVDSLTDLQNRWQLEGVLARMCEPKLILLDIDSFKAINEYYGTGIGDFILQDVASLLKRFWEGTWITYLSYRGR